MLYRIGTGSEIASLPDTLPPAAYGSDRDYSQVGGYALIAETDNDVSAIREILDLDHHPTEWVKVLDREFLSVLFLLNDDYAVVVYLPVDLAPSTLQKELENEL